MNIKIIGSLDFYKDLAPHYDELAEVGDFPPANLVFNIAAPHLTPDIKTILDVGIGTGLSSKPFKEEGYAITGMDGSGAMLDICRRKKIADRLLQHDFKRAAWPLPTGGFDAAISAATLYFMDPDNHRKILDEMHRVTRPLGIYAFNYEVLQSGRPYARFNIASFDVNHPQHVLTYAMSPAAIRTILSAHNSQIIAADTRPVSRKPDGTTIVFETLVCRNLG